MTSPLCLFRPTARQFAITLFAESNDFHDNSASSLPSAQDAGLGNERRLFGLERPDSAHTITHNSSLNAQLAEVLEAFNEGSDTPVATPEGFNSRFPVTLANHLLYGRFLDFHGLPRRFNCPVGQ
jgi:hypothetical protein